MEISNSFVKIYISKALAQTARLKIPVAHGEGRYYADENVLDELEANGQVLYRYCDEQGEYNAGGKSKCGFPEYRRHL